MIELGAKEKGIEADHRENPLQQKRQASALQTPKNRSGISTSMALVHMRPDSEATTADR